MPTKSSNCYQLLLHLFHHLNRQVRLLGAVQEVRVVEGGEPGAGRPQVLRVHLAPAGRPPAERRHLHRKQKVPRRVARHEHGELPSEIDVRLRELETGCAQPRAHVCR